MIRQAHFRDVVVRAFLLGCVVLLVVLGSRVRAEASQEKEKGHTEATNTEQGHSGGAASEGDRCDRTRTISRDGAGYLTNDLPGCPNKGGLLSAQLPDTGKRKISDPEYGLLSGEKGDDEIRGSSTSDEIYAGDGDDVIYGASGGDWVYGDRDDDVIHAGGGNDYSVVGGKGADVIYGGEGNDDALVGGGGNDVVYGGPGDDTELNVGGDGQRDKLYCGEGTDKYEADPIDYVHSSCEKGKLVGTGGPPLLLLAGAALCSALMMLRYVIRSA